MPALEKNRSIGPWSFSTVSIRCWMSSSLPTSVVKATPLTSFAVAVAADHQFCAVLVEAFGQSFADAAGGAGDDDDFVLDLHAVSPLSLWPNHRV
jgi:hypothetical protein